MSSYDLIEELYDLILENFPWLEDLLNDDEAPIEDVIAFVGGLAYKYGYEAGKRDFSAYYDNKNGSLYAELKAFDIKKYDN
jgi:hypothetical protein